MCSAPSRASPAILTDCPRNMVSVPFYQVLRTSVPVFTVLIYRVVYSRTYDTVTYLTLVPIMLGAALTTIGEYTFTDIGFLLTFAGVILAAIKVC